MWNTWEEHPIERTLQLRDKPNIITACSEATHSSRLCEVCEDCQTFFLEMCSTHGPPVFIKDTLVHGEQPNRSALTLPAGMSIGPSSIPFAGLGVWNEASTFPKGVHFGPYEGKITDDDEAANSGYSWVITKGRNCYEYVDAKDESTSNWMRYVNCARNEEEQNLVAFQYLEQIYYRTCKAINTHCELFVWYGDEYGKELGIKWNLTWKNHPPRKAQHGTGVYPCSSCTMAFSNQEYLSKHVKRKHPERLVEPVHTPCIRKAPVSSQTSPTFRADHTLNIDDPAVVQDPHLRAGEQQCTGGEPFRHLNGLTQDADINTQGEPGIRKEGDKMSDMSEKSQRTNIGEKLQSKEIGERINNSGDMNKHQRKNNGKNPHTCTRCAKSFSSLRGLRTHQRTHTGEKPYTCKQCGKCFTTSGNMITHQRTHTGEKPYTCKQCGKCFTNSGNMITHQRTHTGEKPYTCKQCGKCFTDSGNMIKHQRTHTGEKPYTCKQCGKCFSRVNSLIGHQRTHTGEKPYTCKQCGKCFSRVDSLSRHQGTH
ncbi:histone-lysine N-methyltransferase PRDM9-like [Ambystoma mexicanum]|uniref:histone-lysine N-methyltransferase PRDM9-like n=1 Tax=Ambystoma mexicanum TaxID=8296 RepID=UPI0037E76480